MRAVEIEGWARRVIQRVAEGSVAEDAHVELKGDWLTESNRAARRIAGHCNAGSPDPVLWLIGVDEQFGVKGASNTDFADWWQRVRSEFEGDVPLVHDLVLTSEHGKSVVALVFDTERAPFVVRNAAYGQPSGGAVAYEVPWRQGTSTRSATRADLLRIVLPAAKTPLLDVLDGEAELQKDRGQGHKLLVTLKTYAIVQVGPTIVLPDHQAVGTFEIPDAERRGELNIDLLALSDRRARDELPGRTYTVHQGDRQILLDGPGFFRIVGSAQPVEPFPLEDADTLEVSFSIRPAGADAAAAISARLVPWRKSEPSASAPVIRWRIEPRRRES